MKSIRADTTSLAVANQIIESKIHVVRGKKVMLDKDLALLYGVETRALVQAVKRNADRFPDDFMFQLSKREFQHWRSQNVISNSDKMGLRRAPYAFTEQGVAMLSSVLKSKKAVQVNIQIMRVFTKIGRVLLTHQEIKRRLERIEGTLNLHGKGLDQVSKAMHLLLQPTSEPRPKRKIGF